jgi:hypothetical protein
VPTPGVSITLQTTEATKGFTDDAVDHIRLFIVVFIALAIVLGIGVVKDARLRAAVPVDAVCRAIVA